MPKKPKEAVEAGLGKGGKLADLLDGKDIKQKLGMPEDIEEPDIYSGLTERQKLVQRLHLRRLTQRAIASALNVSVGTVNAELAAIRDHHINRGTGVNRAQTIGEALTLYDEVERYAWDTFHHISPDSPQRLKALELVMKARAESLKTQSTLGLLAVAVEPTDQVAASALLQKFEGTIRNMLIEQLATTHLVPSELADPEPPKPEGTDSESAPELSFSPLADPEPPE